MARRSDILNYLTNVLKGIRVRDLNSANAIAQISDGVVTDDSLDFSGLFYDSATVTFDTPGKVQANAIAVLSGGSVSSVTIDQPGGIYQALIQLLTQLGGLILTQSGSSLVTEQLESSPTVTFSAPQTEGGVTATGTATVNTGFSITSIAVTNGGSGYTAPPSITISAPDRELDAATGTVRIVRGVVESIDMTFGSQQYLFTPNVNISPSSVIFNTQASQVFREFKYLDDVNDFPTITLSGTPRENWSQIESRQPFRSMTQSIRGYVKTGEELDSLHESENLARDIETVIDRFSDMASNLGVERAQVLSVNTDEGLLTPYGVCELQVEIFYEGETV